MKILNTGDNDRIRYRVLFTINTTPEYAPLTISVGLTEYQARILMATPVKSVSIGVEHARGHMIDSLPEPVSFD